MIRFTIRSPKETRGSKKVEVEVFDMPGCFYSCTEAFRKWRQCSTLPEDPEMPVFRRKSGSMLTPRDMNGILKALMKDSVSYEDGFVSTHSFRGGMVSVMYRLGYTEEQIKIQGRWASDAFKHYCKSGRAARLQDQWSLANKISQSAPGQGFQNRTKMPKVSRTASGLVRSGIEFFLNFNLFRGSF